MKRGGQEKLTYTCSRGRLPFGTRSGLHIPESKILEDLLSDFLILNRTDDPHLPPWIFGASQRVAPPVSLVRKNIPTEEGSLKIGLLSVAGCLRNWCVYRLVR